MYPSTPISTMSSNSSNESIEKKVPSISVNSVHDWLQSPWVFKALFFVALLICYGISVNVRYQQLQTWKQNPQQFFVGEQPLMTTLDAPYWLRWAKEYREGEFYGTNHKRSYPTSTQWFREQQAQIIASKNGRQLFVTGHSEYEPSCLLDEYKRDLLAGINPEIPENYFPNNDPSKKPIVTWKSHGNLLFSNWLNYYVYQLTPYESEQIGETMRKATVELS